MFAGPDLLVILVIALIVFGGKRIGDLGAGLGKGIREFKKGLHADDVEATPKQLEDDSRKSKE
jgi:sec-independent protein translocase protein TatA